MRRLLLLSTLLLLCACASDQEIVSGLTEHQANQIVVFLASKGIRAQKVAKEAAGGGGTTETEFKILVPTARSVEAMALLNGSGMPRPKGINLLDIFQGGGLMRTPQEDEIRFQAGLAEQLAGVIRRFDGVLDATVVLSMPSTSGTTPGAKPTGTTTAAVYVKHQGILDDPNSQLVSKIRRLMSASVPELSVENVTVVSERSILADIALSGSIEPSTAPAEWRRVLGVVVEVNSVARMRIILTILIVGLIVFLWSALWLLWKQIRILSAEGWGSLLSFQPYTPPEKPEGDAAAAEGESLEDEQ